MGGLGKGADINSELARALGSEGGTQREWSVPERIKQHQHMGTCTACGKPIQSESIQAMGVLWHPACFKCGGTCGEQFAKTGNQRVLEKNGIPYCESCYDTKFGAQCAANCGRGLGAQRVKAVGGLWHPECFRCLSCKVNLQGGFVNSGGKPCCKGCATK